MHKLMHKGLKKKKKTKKEKKGEEEEFDPEELERYRRKRAEAQEKASAEGGGQTIKTATVAATGSDEWQKFQALTAGVDSILKKTQGDLDRIKSTSFFQRKTPVIEKKKLEHNREVEKNKTKRWIGFDKDGNPIEQTSEDDKISGKQEHQDETNSWIFEVPEEDEDDELSAEEDVFDTTYIDVLQNTEIQLAYIPDSPTQGEVGDDPFDTTNADKVLKTVDKHGKKVVSLGNAVEVLSGRIDHVSTCKTFRPRKVQNQDLLLDDVGILETVITEKKSEPADVEKTLLDEDVLNLPGIDITKLPQIIHASSGIPDVIGYPKQSPDCPIDISEFEVLKEKTILEEIPDLDDDFDIGLTENTSFHLAEVADPFAEKESEQITAESEIIEASFEVAIFVNEEDPFDTTFAEKLVPGKTELKVIERELENLPESKVSISLTDPAGLNRDYETGLLKPENKSFILINDLLGGSSTDLTQLENQPIDPTEEITYVDPFDTSRIQEPAPGHAELKFLEKELLGDEEKKKDDFDDNDFDPRKGEIPIKCITPRPEVTDQSDVSVQVIFESEETEAVITTQKRKPSRPEALELTGSKSVAFDLPTPSQRPDLLITSDEEKTIPSKPLTPYYSQKSLEEIANEEQIDEADVDPFDTTFVSKVTPGKTELRLIESELLKQETKLTHSISDQDLNPRNQINQVNNARRQSDFGIKSVGSKNLQFFESSKVSFENEQESTNIYKINEEVHRKELEPKKQESILDTEINVNAKALTPTIEKKILREVEDKISYLDPFDTSIASNIVPGKAELKLLENELNQISEEAQPINVPAINLNISSITTPTPLFLNNDDDFDPRAGKTEKSQDFLSLDGLDTGDKVLTPVTSQELLIDNSDPFDTSFALISPGKIELKLLESELVEK